MTHPQVSYLFQILELGLLSKAISLISCTPFRVPFTGLYSSWPRVYPPSIAIHISYILRYIYFRFVPQTNLQPSHNLCQSSPPSKWLAPTRRKSYQMFFQNVTHFISTSNMMLKGATGLSPLSVNGEGWG